jgi:hypothetical protein
LATGGVELRWSRLRQATRRVRGPSADPIAEGVEDGYAAIDALVALMILTSTLICALTAAHQAAEVARFALETRQATVLGRYLIETAPVQPGVRGGRTESFSWKQSVSEPVMAVGASAICVQRANIVADKSHRTFAFESNVVCSRAAAT